MRNGKIASKLHKKAPMSHSSLLVPMIDRVMKKARLKLGDIDGFCVSIGPGSFTGLRIGVATVKGLACALKKPIVAVPTLDAIAENARALKGIICPVLDARKGKVYACLYRSDGKDLKKISKYLLLPTLELKERLKKHAKDDIIFLGDTAEDIFLKDWHPRAEIVAKLGLENFRKKRFVSAGDLEPFYIYSKECDIRGI